MADDPQKPENTNTPANPEKVPPTTPPTPETPPAPPPGYDRVEQTGVFQMLWDCKYCNTKKLLGVTHKFCPNCGSAQDATARYFPSDEEAIAVEDHEYTGADKKCGNCGTPNAAKAEFCTQCGSPMKDAKSVAMRSEQTTAEGTQFGADSKSAAKTDFEAQKSGIPTTPPEPPKSKKWWIIGGSVAAAAVIGLVASFFVTSTVDVRVDGHSWEKRVAIEAYKPRVETSWCDAKPFNAYSITTRREVRSYNQVADGETCNNVRVDRGNGTFSTEKRCKTKYKKEPVYDSKCYYKVDRWGPERDIVAKGTLKETPAWPAVNIRTGNCLGCERESGRSETFSLALTQVKKADKKHNCSYKEAQWRSIPDGAVKKIKVRLIGGAKCETLQ